MLELTISSVKTAVANTIVFTFIPLTWWFIKHRKEVTFFEWIGLYKPQLKSKIWVLALFAVLYYFFYNFDFTKLVNPETLKEIENSSSVAANTFAGIGTMAILPALIENFVANGLAEEILYRGFLCKRFCEKAVLFGLMHNIIYIIAGLNVGLWYHTLTFIFTGTGALLLGYLNEKIFNGSIVPSILLHGTGNFIASMLVAFA